MSNAEWLQKWLSVKTPQDVCRIFGGCQQGPTEKPVERQGDPKPVYRVDKTQGPMQFLGGQICKRMGQIGYPSKIAQGYRSPAVQEAKRKKGLSKAGAFQSAHQFYEACDICHKTQGWPPTNDPYWKALQDVAENVEDDFGVRFVMGRRDWGWDFAHIELADWRQFRNRCRDALGHYRKPTDLELLERFKEVLPQIDLDKLLLREETDRMIAQRNEDLFK